ncbi:MAG: tetratricopeptide repeat protein [Thermoanaerobaculia bacterium]|nr:tetratricopeptide repeat protein [Thermoanaerobaculia bacterium]
MRVTNRRTQALAAALLTVGLLLGCGEEAPIEMPEVQLEGVPTVVERAIQQALRRVKENPEDGTDWGRLGMVLDVHDQSSAALEAYRQAEALDSEDYRWPYLAGRILERTERVEAIAALERAAAKRPDNAAVGVNLGQLYFEAGRREEARRTWQRIVSEHPNSAHGWYGLAQIRTREGSLEEARLDLERCLEIQRDFREGYTLLAQVLRLLGDDEGARRKAEMAVNFPALAPIPDPLLGEMSRLGVGPSWSSRRGEAFARKGDFVAAESEFRKALEGDDPTARDWANLGGALTGQGRHREALEAYEEGLTIDPEDAFLRNNRSGSLFRLGRVEDAEESLRSLMAEDPTYIEPWLNLGELLLATGRPRDAVGVLVGAVDQEPGRLAALKMLGQAYVLAGQPVLALETWQQLLAYDRNDLDVRFDAALLAVRTGDHQLALVFLEAGGASDRLQTLLAWELSTAPGRWIDPLRALQLAERLAERHPNDVTTLDALAAAQAASGAMDLAVATGERAQQLALEQGRTGLAEQLGARIEIYRTGGRFVQPR